LTNDIITLFNALDPIPDGTSDRFDHRDLSGGDEYALVRELTFLRVLNFLATEEWHLERELAVASELQRRRKLRNQRYGRPA
jgi:hypothetical protein